MKLARILGLLFPVLAALPTVSAGPVTSSDKKTIEPVEPTAAEKWQFKLAVPSWIAGTYGDAGINGTTSHSVIGFNEVVNKIDMAGSIRGEAGKGRFGAMFDFSYLSISDGIGQKGVLKKIDFQQDQILGDLGVRWRVVEGSKGWVDVIAGTRYTYLHERLALQGNDGAIREASNRLAAVGTLLRVKAVEDELESLRSTTRFSGPSLNVGEAVRLVRELQRLRAEGANFREEVADRIRANTEERARKIEKALNKALNRQLSRTDDWFDPYVGFRVRYNFNEKYYFTARGDISPFDVGADFAWQASAGFGAQLTPSIYGELVYRALDVEYRHDGLVYDTTSYGPELTLGINF